MLARRGPRHRLSRLKFIQAQVNVNVYDEYMLASSEMEKIVFGNICMETLNSTIG